MTSLHSVLWMFGTFLTLPFSAQTRDCPSTYHKILLHAACLDPNPKVDFNSPYPSAVTEEDKAIVLQAHNHYRANTVPRPADSQRLYWDDELALAAQSYAEQCNGAHNDAWKRYVPGRNLYVGQNIHWTNEPHGWRAAVCSWFLETQNYQYGVGAIRDIHADGQIGHLMQFLWGGAARVGCGTAHCKDVTQLSGHTDDTQFYICHYAVGYGEGDYTEERPYNIAATEEACALCPDNCRDGLCDCGGKLCHNGGTLDVATCQCMCPDRPGIFGDNCDVDCSLVQDYDNCGNFPAELLCNSMTAIWKCPNKCQACVQREGYSGRTYEPAVTSADVIWPQCAAILEKQENAPKQPAMCHAAYRAIPGHTACLHPFYDVKIDSDGTNRHGVSAQDKITIVQRHNKVRSEAKATNMQMMYWDEDLAELAQSWADQCSFYSEANNNRRWIPGRNGQVSQLIFRTSQLETDGNWERVMFYWERHMKEFVYGVGDIRGDQFQNAYVQMVYGPSSRVGCGVATCIKRYCPTSVREECRDVRIMVCNYAAGVLEAGHNLKRPYEQGSQCSQCPGNCNNGLCDCKGKVCYNGGTLDLNTCSCRCPSRPGVVGPECQMTCDATTDKDWCRGDTESCKYFYGNRLECPHTCHACPGADTLNYNERVFLPGGGEEATTQRVPGTSTTTVPTQPQVTTRPTQPTVTRTHAPTPPPDNTIAPTPSSGDFITTYEGCFADADDRDIPLHLSFDDNTPDKCADECWSRGYTVIGLQFGRACFCGHYFGKHGPSIYCSIPCPGDASANCGGGWANAVYSLDASNTPPRDSTTVITTEDTTTTTPATPTTTTPAVDSTTTNRETMTTSRPISASTAPQQLQLTYLGCYLDAPKSDLEYEVSAKVSYKINSPQSCARICHGRGYPVLGLQWGDRCYCGSRFGRYGPSRLWPCYSPCPGDSRATCGGPWTNSIYRIDSSTSTYFPINTTSAHDNTGPSPSTTTSVVQTTPAEDDTSPSSSTSTSSQPTSTMPSTHPTQKAGFSFEYRGCWYDESLRDLDGEVTSFPGELTPLLCGEFCYDREYRFFGVQFGRGCFCGNSYGKYVEGSSDACSMPCEGDVNMLCGGVWHNSVYAISG